MTDYEKDETKNKTLTMEEQIKTRHFEAEKRTKTLES